MMERMLILHFEDNYKNIFFVTIVSFRRTK